jgi:fatty acid desaturase
MYTLSRNEILRHNKKNDCWIIVRNDVYDISAFISSHPGGMDILLSRAGEDATSFFITRHAQSKQILRHLEKMKIGELSDNEKINVSDYDEPFLMELIEWCTSAKLYDVPPFYKNVFFYVRLLLIFLFWGLSISALYLGLHKVLCIPLVILQSMIGTSLFGLLAHEDTHRPITQSTVLNYLLKISWPVFWPFISQNPLRYEHNSHHVKIGDPEFDFEVAGFSSFIRYSDMVEYRRVHRFQHILAPILYPFYANIITTVGGIRSRYWSRHNKAVAVEHSLSVAGSLIYYIVLPSLIYGFSWWFVLLYVIYQSVLFYGIYIGSAINHFIPQANISIPEGFENKYAYYICQNTSNFCLESNFWFWFTGGFNVQVEHHLIPFVPAENLKKMIPIVKELCVKYNYPYREYSSFGNLWRDHYSYLRNLANVDADHIAELLNKKAYQAR